MAHDLIRRIPRLARFVIGMVSAGFAAALLLGVPACGGDDPYGSDNGGGGGTFNGTIRVLDSSFSPRNVTVSVGDSVTWRWDGSLSHTVTQGTSPNPPSPVFDSGAPKSSGTYGYRFQAADVGALPYICEVHVGMGMTGTITVEP